MKKIMYSIKEFLISLIELRYDFHYHIKTSIIESYCGYGPTRYKDLKKIFKNSEIFANAKGLVDFGCGKGRVLCMAAIYGIKNLYGVEINSKMYNKALYNINNIQRRFHCGYEIEIINADAKNFAINEKMNIFFFFTPFHIKIFMKVYRNILKSIKVYPRDVYIVLYKPFKFWVDYLYSEKLIEIPFGLFSVFKFQGCDFHVEK